MVSATAEQNAIVIEDVGPVERVAIPLPPGGGLVVLRGANGAGKSESLEAINGLLGNDPARKALRPRDGAKKGSIVGCGVTITVGRQNRVGGELEVAALDDKLDIGALVDPGIKDPAAADRRRLQALIRVSMTSADPDLFASLSPEPLGDVVPAEVLDKKDLIEQAGGIKRAFEKKARDAEEQVELIQRKESVLLESVKDVDLTGESDEASLRAEYERASRAVTEIETRIDDADKAAQAASNARLQLERAKESYKGPSVTQAELDVRGAEADEQVASAKVRRLEEELNQAKADYQASRSATAIKRQSLDAARQHESTIASWTETVEASIPPCPTSVDLAAANEVLSAARTALQQGEVVRRAKSKLTEAKTLRATVNSLSQKSESWRSAAAGVDGVLSGIVEELGSPISVGEDDKGDTRLTVNHPRRGLMFFADLSVGEKWALALPIAIKAVGDGGVIVIPQEAYEGLDPTNRGLLARLLKGSNVTAITALPADGPLSAEEIALN